ncbi:hypothetical protein PVAND_004811 [Polypedilum vanderplanki]|uniref:Gamma-secretase subunit PEN-2 n=1 Tax=Polypedilum vanderplanki TaxID=319348 RepID=A0A9J6BYP6_POLVA|nr:hypothetical protein PVAND_004811 [Polypedilum vanderplanki]
MVFSSGISFSSFVWLINFFWFYDSAFKQPPFDEQNTIRKYVIMSGIGTLFWIIALTTWIIIFQTNRIAWGEFGDELSFIIPLGSK